MSAIIEIDNLTKCYPGRPTNAVDHLDLTVESGDIFGFVGPNGSGKTTTIRILCTLLRPNSGEIRVAGHSVLKAPRLVRKTIGYMPDFFGVYPDMLVWEYLDFFAACYDLPSASRPALIGDLLELVELAHRRNDPVESLSRGMKQRLSLARTLLHDPQVLVLDEPASGLDPRARIEIRELLVELAKMGKTIFFSTHILADVAQICTRVGIMEAGKLVAAGRLEELGQVLLPHRTITITLLGGEADVQKALAFLQDVPGVQNITSTVDVKSKIQLEFSGDDAALQAILAGLVSAGVPVMHFSEDTRDMEQVFLRATKGMVT